MAESMTQELLIPVWCSRHSALLLQAGESWVLPPAWPVLSYRAASTTGLAGSGSWHSGRQDRQPLFPSPKICLSSIKDSSIISVLLIAVDFWEVFRVKSWLMPRQQEMLFGESL